MDPSMTDLILTHEPFIDGSFFLFTDGVFFGDKRRSFQDGEECCIGSVHSVFETQGLVYFLLNVYLYQYV